MTWLYYYGVRARVRGGGGRWHLFRRGADISACGLVRRDSDHIEADPDRQPKAAKACVKCRAAGRRIDEPPPSAWNVKDILTARVRRSRHLLHSRCIAGALSS